MSTRTTPGCDRELVRVVLGLMIAVYSPAGILTAVWGVELVTGLVMGRCSLHSIGASDESNKFQPELS